MDWISCFNRLTGGIYATPLLYSGSFYDSDVSYAPVLPVFTAIIAMGIWAIIAIGNLIAWLVVWCKTSRKKEEANIERKEEEAAKRKRAQAIRCCTKC